MDSIFQQIAHQINFCFKISKSFTCILNVLIIYTVTSIYSLSLNITLNCGTEKFITSRWYPSLYPNDASDEWNIAAPSHSRILITFYDFNLEYLSDNMEVFDKFNHSTRSYTGEKIFPPFLSQGPAIIIDFKSNRIGRKKGFNISASCNEPSGLFQARLEDGTSPEEGFFELRSESGEWKRVCEESLSSTVANVICTELGYPGTDIITYMYFNDTCLVGEKCIRAPTCQDNTYRLQDCTQEDSACTSNISVKIKCKDVGYRGCYDLGSQHMENGFSFKSKEHCISSCRRNNTGSIAVMNHSECFCSTQEIMLEGLLVISDNECASISESSSKMKVYSAYVGFCDYLNDISDGSWDSDITWLGSIVHVTCSNGYSLNGSKTLQCVPESSTYYPKWNASAPNCVRNEDNTQSTTVNMPVKIAVPVIVILTVFIIVGILVYFIGKNKCSSRKGGFQQSPEGTWDVRRSIDQRTSHGSAVLATTESRSTTDGPARGNAGRGSSNPTNVNTIDSTASISVISPAPHGIAARYSQPTQVLPTPPPVPPSRHSNALRLLHQINPTQQNHYMSPNNEQNPHYYATSNDNQRDDSTRLEEPYQEPAIMNITNCTYEGTVDQEQAANLGNARVAYYATSPVSPSVTSTLATSPEEIYHEPSILNLNKDPHDSKDVHYYASSSVTSGEDTSEDTYNKPSNTQRSDQTYEGAGDQVTPNTMMGNILKAGLSMISRPLPHRPSSTNCKEGPSLPPRKASRGSQHERTASLRKRKPAIVNENNNSVLGACSLDCSAQQNLRRDDIVRPKQKGLPETPLYYTLEKEDRNRVHRQDNLDNPKKLKEDKLDPFYHCLENNNNDSSSDSGIIQYNVPVSTNTQDSTDMTDSSGMINNILYTPMPSQHGKKKISK